MAWCSGWVRSSARPISAGFVSSSGQEPGNRSSDRQDHRDDQQPFEGGEDQPAQTQQDGQHSQDASSMLDPFRRIDVTHCYCPV